jgi:glutamate-1-semialdehyde 2,1-aminomutase
VIVPWNDAEAVIEATERHEFAAILAEPVPANMGVVSATPGFAELLRERADATGALLVFDEVISGFRVDRGGAQATYSFVPDLTILGKVIGGGFPAAAYGGPRSLMERIAPAGDVYQAGTLSGNPVACAAGLATIAQLNDAAYEQLARTTETIANGLREAAAEAGRPVQVQTATGLLTVFFADEPVRNYADAAACDLDAYGAWCRALLDRGVYPPASQFEAWFPSLAHTDAELDRTIDAARAAFAEIA